MKKFIYFITLLLLGASCSDPQEIEEIFGTDPDQRIADTLLYVKSTLVDAPNGWKGHLTTEYGGGYGFYMEFMDNDRIKMVADLTDQTASEVKESTFRIRQIMAATLSFDTYTYLTMLQDPNPGVYGGLSGRGLGSDVEYNYLRTNGDTLVFEGRKFNKQQLILVKASKAESEAYLAGSYQSSIAKTNKFFADNANPYIELGDAKYQISINSELKLVDGTAVLGGNEVVSRTAKYYYTLNGVKSTHPITLSGQDIVELRWKENKLYALSNQGEEFEIKNSAEPIMPLHLLIGKRYGLLYSPFLTYLPGTSAQGLDILKFYHEGLGNRATGYFFNYGEISFIWDATNQRVLLAGFSSQNGGSSGWATIITYDYTLDNATGVFRLTQRTGATGGYTSAILQPMHNFLLNSSFTLTYHTEGGATYAKISGIERPDVVMTFILE